MNRQEAARVPDPIRTKLFTGEPRAEDGYKEWGWEFYGSDGKRLIAWAWAPTADLAATVMEMCAESIRSGIEANEQK